MIDWSDLIDTIIKVGFGALLAGLFSYFIARYNHKKSIEDNNLHRLNINIYDPIIKHIDEQLILMSKTYWNYVDSINSKDDYIEKVKDYLEEFRQKEGIILARIKMLNNQELIDLFKEISQIYLQFRLDIEEHKMNDSFKNLNKAYELAGEIFNQLLIIKK